MNCWGGGSTFLVKELLDGDLLRVEEERGHVVVVARLAEIGSHCGVDGVLAVIRIAGPGLGKING